MAKSGAESRLGLLQIIQAIDQHHRSRPVQLRRLEHAPPYPVGDEQADRGRDQRFFPLPDFALGLGFASAGGCPDCRCR